MIDGKNAPAVVIVDGAVQLNHTSLSMFLVFNPLLIRDQQI
jgi:hypothetical protein